MATLENQGLSESLNFSPERRDGPRKKLVRTVSLPTRAIFSPAFLSAGKDTSLRKREITTRILASNARIGKERSRVRKEISDTCDTLLIARYRPIIIGDSSDVAFLFAMYFAHRRTEDRECESNDRARGRKIFKFSTGRVATLVGNV